jgi:hypothetical protein
MLSRVSNPGGEMNRPVFVLGIVAASSTLVVVEEGSAGACGGCFNPPTPPTQTTTDITDERMLLSVSPTQTTLYDQIRYSGAPASFAWVLPIHGAVTVGLSADVLFDSIDALTATQISAPPSSCPPPPNCTGGGCGASSSGSAEFSGEGENPGLVTVTKQENVGPYTTVQLHATDSSALNAWLTQNGFVIPGNVTPILDEYVVEGFDFLAMKLLPDQGVQSMRPVRVTSPGASLSLPLRMAAVGTGVTVGITIWVVSDGRYEPQNFPFYHIEDGALVWDWATSSSNYAAVRAQNEAAPVNKNWEIECSITLNQQLVGSVILSGGQYRSGGGGGLSQAAVDPSGDYLPVHDTDPDAGAGSNGAIVQTAEEVRNADIIALFDGIAGPNARVTRIRSDIAQAAMTADLVLQASADQSELSNVRNLTQSVNETCPLYDGCNNVGTGTPSQAVAHEKKSGCAASAQSVGGPSSGFGAVGCLFGLALARTFFGRRRRKQES